MKFIAAAAVWLGVAFSPSLAAAQAHCPQVNTYPFTGGCPIPTSQLNAAIAAAMVPTPAEGSGAQIYASAYGVVANGTTSDDAAMQAALTACAAVKGRLILPPGSILLTGVASLNMNSCSMEGAGVAPGGGALKGTTFLLTSTSTIPFILGDGGITLKGINFYWPNQIDGVTVYPPLFTDTPVGVFNMYWDNIRIINAYDGYKQSASSGGIGLFFINNSVLYAVHDLFTVASVGSYMLFSNVGFGHGAWLDAAGSTFAVKTAVDLASGLNSMFHIIAPITGPGAVISIINGTAFAWGWGFKLDNTARIDFGNIDMAIDGVVTHIDTTAGGTLNNFTMRCNSCTAGKADAFTGSGTGGKATAFKLGTLGALRLRDSLYNTAAGSLIETAGASVYISNSSVAFGSNNDGTDFYLVNATASVSGTHVELRNNLFSGVPASTKHHGLRIASGMDGFVLSGNRVAYLYDLATVALGTGEQQFIGNISADMTGTVDIVTSGAGEISYVGNVLHKPPLPVVSSCGSGASLSGGPIAGVISVGSTNPTTTCLLTMPFQTEANSCVFTPTNPFTLYATPAGTPPAWTITGSATMHSSQIYYQCGGGR